MWGCISTEAVYQFNFNTSFSTTRSDVLVHLAQWQYWWWFWFTFLWSFYYLLTSKLIRFRSLKMRPKIATSYRPHGKWGDFLAAIIPILWCLNILTNSNFILRLMEWQNEASLFTVRIRARQWYWVYKFELKNFTDILSAPKNVGHNKWHINVFGDLQTTDDYLHILQLRAQNKWIKNYWATVLDKTGKVQQSHIVSPYEQLKLDLINIYNINKMSDNLHKKFTLYTDIEKIHFMDLPNFNNLKLNFLAKDKLQYFYSYLNTKNSIWSVEKSISNISRHFSLDNEIDKDDAMFSLLSNNIINVDNKILNLYTDFNETSRYTKRMQGVILPIRIIKYPFNSDILNKNCESDILFRFRFGDGESKINQKTVPHTTYLTLKQKRYKRKKVVPSQIKFYHDESNKRTKIVRYSGKPVLLNNSIFEENFNDTTLAYRMLKKNKKRTELIPVTLAKRLLRVKKTLILPAHLNITLITNSYDIVHSWFIPGLGVKLDCVPGRSTHHTFYIDCVGFYYGQCAEICGRYHHHMPIRVCALPFEHFLVWWNTFGLPKMLATTNEKRYETYYSFRKYVW